MEGEVAKLPARETVGMEKGGERGREVHEDASLMTGREEVEGERKALGGVGLG